MDSLLAFFNKIGPVYGALVATTFTWLMTALGASTVFFFKKILAFLGVFPIPGKFPGLCRVLDIRRFFPR